MIEKRIRNGNKINERRLMMQERETERKAEEKSFKEDRKNCQRTRGGATYTYQTTYII